MYSPEDVEMHPNLGKLMAIMELRQYASFSDRYDDDASKIPASWADTISRIRVINGQRYREEAAREDSDA